ncbi:hypothetical protein CCP3SC1_960011 [Gammaproteobacteria bacterium]
MVTLYSPSHQEGVIDYAKLPFHYILALII